MQFCLNEAHTRPAHQNIWESIEGFWLRDHTRGEVVGGKPHMKFLRAIVGLSACSLSFCLFHTGIHCQCILVWAESNKWWWDLNPCASSLSTNKFVYIQEDKDNKGIRCVCHWIVYLQTFSNNLAHCQFCNKNRQWLLFSFLLRNSALDGK